MELCAVLDAVQSYVGELTCAGLPGSAALSAARTRLVDRLGSSPAGVRRLLAALIAARRLEAGDIPVVPISESPEQLALAIADYTRFVSRVEWLCRSADGPEIARVRRAIEFVVAHASTAVSLDAVARHVGWSKWHCARMIRRHAGATLTSVVRRLRVDLARRLLADSRLSIKEVAALCGFPRSGDLNRAFHAEYSMSPSAHRQAITGQQ